MILGDIDSWKHLIPSWPLEHGGAMTRVVTPSRQLFSIPRTNT